MKPELKRFYQRAAGMLLLMLLTTTTAWATDLTDFLPVSSSGTATGYFAFSNHFFRVDWSGINTSQTSSVKLTYNRYDYLCAQRNGDTSSDASFLYATNSTSSAWKTWYITERTPGQSSDGYTSDADLAPGASSYDKKKVCTVTCMAANAPTWNWSADCTTCTATFTCSDYPSLTATVNATVTLSGITATASVTFNGSNYSDSKNPTYSITYVLNGGTNAAGNPSTYTAGTGVASLASPTRTGYTFGGWYDNPGFSGSAVTSISASTTGTVTLYAKWTANQYTVVYNANGGSGTMSNQTFTYDAAQQLRANTFTKTGKLFDGWKDDNNNSYTASQSVINLTATNNGTVTLYAQWKEDPAYITGSGTENDPYIISSIEKWNTFANESNYAKYWATGTHIQLGANISGVTTMVGTDSHRFCGTFNGQGYTLSVNYTVNSERCAPFRFTDGATIKKLNVAGTITTSMFRAAGLIGKAYGTTNVSDCRSSVTINSSYNGSGYHAGFIASTGEGSTTNITNCVFDGSINFTGSGERTNGCGGFVRTSYGNINISNCLLNATFDIDNTGCYTFSGGKDINVHVENSYYITAIGTVQGTQAYTARQSFPCKSATILGTTVYYAADLTPFGKTDNYSPDGSADHPYIISNANGWEYFCDALQDNDTWNRFSGKTVKLDANIGTAQNPITRMAGSSTHDFCGTFDGQGNTLTVKYGESGTPASVENVAPFSYVSNTKANPSDAEDSPAAIKNLHVAGDIYTSAKYAAGIVGQHWGTLNIKNCRSSVVIHSSVSGDGTHGGFEGASNGTLTIEGCVFDGSLLGTTTHSVGGFIGWRKGTANIYNSLFAPAAVTVSNTTGATFGRNDVDTHNCYYTYYLCDGEHYVPYYATDGITRRNGHAPLAVTAGEDVTISAISPVGDATATYSVSGITAYAKGITRTVNETTTFYYGQGDDVSLTLSNTAGEAPLGYQHAYAASAGTLSGTTLTMPAEDVTISNALAPIDWATESTGLDWDHAYMIYNKDQLDLLAQRVNSGTGDDYAASGYSGKYFKLGADITYSHTTDWNDATSTENNYTAIGGMYNGTFSGYFDGQNHVVSGIRIYKNDNSYNDMCQGLFGVLYFESGTAEIKNVILADARITGSLETGGIVGANCGTVSNCHVLSNVNIHAVQNGTGYHGGIAGNNYDGCTITACTSAASITSVAGSGCQYYGGIVGDNYGNVSDCLYLGNTVEGNSSVGAIVGDRSDGTVTNCYFTSTASSLPNKAVGSGGGNKVTNCGLAPQDNTDNSKFLTLMAARNAALTAVSRTEPLSTAVDITLNGRTLYKDGDWNTLCLPFNVTLAGSPLEGATVMKLIHETSKLTNGTLTLNFEDETTTLQAGTPYIIKWTKADGYDEASEDTRDLKNPVFTSVTIDNSASTEVSFTGGKFKGTYCPNAWNVENKSILLLGTNNTLYWPKPADEQHPVSIGACRAYFDLGTYEAREFVLNFGEEDETTEIRTTNLTLSDNEWYTIDGRKLQGKPTRPGLYIHGNRKVAIK